MGSSTSVDNFVPEPVLFVDNQAFSGRAVEKAVNDGPEQPLSTALSTMLITYTRVVTDVFGSLEAANARIRHQKPTSFPQLWITCG
jgi:hypothetical protein